MLWSTSETFGFGIVICVKSNTGRCALALLLVAAWFVAGAISRDEVAANYESRWNRALRHLSMLSAAVAAPDNTPAPQTSPAQPPQPLRSREHLETALLPLLKDIVSIPVEAGLGPGSGGGIVVVDDRIIVVDQHGKFATVADKGNRIEKLPLPELSNNAAEYERLAAPPREIAPGFTVNAGFTVHDVESRREAGGIRLYVSYEKFLPELRTTALTVSAILLSERFAPLGS